MPEITPEHAKLIHAKHNKSKNTTSVVPNPHQDIFQEHINPNEETTNAVADLQKEESADAKIQGGGVESNFRTGNQRGASDLTAPNVKGPSRAQELFDLKQTNTGYMAGLPRQKFQYVATFRFSSDNDFQKIFRTSIDAQVATNSAPDQYNGADAGFYETESDAYKDGLQITRDNVIRSLRNDLIWNIKSIDGPKVNLQLDVLNQYNKKRNVYRTRNYDPINVSFYDTMNSTSMQLWKYLYEYYINDGNNKSNDYNTTGGKQGKQAPYGMTALARPEDFTQEHNYGLLNNFRNTDYLIKSLDLFLIHGNKYTLIRYVHPKIMSMDHDIFTYETSAPVELRMQFAYESVLYETINHSMDDQKDMNVDLKELFRTAVMPETPTIDTRIDGAGEGSLKDDSYLTKMTGDMNLQDNLTAKTAGSGSNNMTGNQRGDVGTVNQRSNGALGSILGGTPVSDAISKVSEAVYGATKGAVSNFSAGGVSGGGGGGFNIGGMGNMFAQMGPGDGRYNPDSSNYQKPKGGVVKDSKGRVVNDSNGRPVRQGRV